MTNGHILYIAPNIKSTFVRRDIQLLSKRYKVSHNNQQWTKVYLIPLLCIQQFFFLLRKTRGVTAIIVMFAGYWSLLPVVFGKIFRKPVYVILGGADCVSFPSIRYGSLRKPLLRIVIKYSLKYAKCLVPVDETLVYAQNKYRKYEDSPVQGYKFHIPDVLTPAVAIPNGFDVEYFKKDEVNKKAFSFITVGPIPSHTRYLLKGIDLLVELAKIFSESSFTVVGVSKNMMNGLVGLPDNVTLIEFLDIDSCKEAVSKSEFYLQLSVSEGFPNAICEAMLLECIPIGTSVGAIPKIIGETGLVITNTRLDQMSEDIAHLLYLGEATKEAMGRAARQRIVENYPLEKRERLLGELIDSRK